MYFLSKYLALNASYIIMTYICMCYCLFPDFGYKLMYLLIFWLITQGTYWKQPSSKIMINLIRNKTASMHDPDGGYGLLSGWGLSCYNTEAWPCTITGNATRTRYNHIHHTRRLARALALKYILYPTYIEKYLVKNSHWVHYYLSIYLVNFTIYCL